MKPKNKWKWKPTFSDGKVRYKAVAVDNPQQAQARRILERAASQGAQWSTPYNAKFLALFSPYSDPQCSDIDKSPGEWLIQDTIFLSSQWEKDRNGQTYPLVTRKFLEAIASRIRQVLDIKVEVQDVT